MSTFLFCKKEYLRRFWSWRRERKRQRGCDERALQGIPFIIVAVFRAPLCSLPEQKMSCKCLVPRPFSDIVSNSHSSDAKLTRFGCISDFTGHPRILPLQYVMPPFCLYRCVSAHLIAATALSRDACSRYCLIEREHAQTHTYSNTSLLGIRESANHVCCSNSRTSVFSPSTTSQ